MYLLSSKTVIFFFFFYIKDLYGRSTVYTFHLREIVENDNVGVGNLTVMFKASKTIYLPQFTGRFLQNRTEITLFNCFILLGFEIKSAVQLVKCYSVQFSSVLVVAVQEKQIIDTCCTKRGTSVLQCTSRHTESTFSGGWNTQNLLCKSCVLCFPYT